MNYNEWFLFIRGHNRQQTSPTLSCELQPWPHFSLFTAAGSCWQSHLICAETRLPKNRAATHKHTEWLFFSALWASGVTPWLIFFGSWGTAASQWHSDGSFVLTGSTECLFARALQADCADLLPVDRHLTEPQRHLSSCLGKYATTPQDMCISAKQGQRMKEEVTGGGTRH